MKRRGQVVGAKREVVDFLLAGNSTCDAIDRFGFRTYKAANLYIYRAFKSLGIRRPHYYVVRLCRFCGQSFAASRQRQECCQTHECIKAYRREWKNARYQKHTGKAGPNSASDTWNFCWELISSGVFKAARLQKSKGWEYKLERVRLAKWTLQKQREKDPPLKVRHVHTRNWNEGLKVAALALDFTLRYSLISQWNKIALSVQKSLRNQGRGGIKWP